MIPKKIWNMKTNRVASNVLEYEDIHERVSHDERFKVSDNV